MDAGRFIQHGVVGLLVGRGGQKGVGWFGGDGLRGTGDYLDGFGNQPGMLFALIAGRARVGSWLLL